MGSASVEMATVRHVHFSLTQFLDDVGGDAEFVNELGNAEAIDARRHELALVSFV